MRNADEAIFARRNFAVEQERAIRESELEFLEDSENSNGTELDDRQRERLQLIVVDLQRLSYVKVLQWTPR